MKKILALSGSLRTRSSNEMLLRAASKLAPPQIQISLFNGLGNLPLFNPDLDRERPPRPVQEFRALVGTADGLLISSPEYAHGVPGALKNALDWLVSSTEFPEKKVILMCSGEFAPQQLEETLKTMSARVLRTFTFFAPLLRNAFNEAGELKDQTLLKNVKDCLELF